MRFTIRVLAEEHEALSTMLKSTLQLLAQSKRSDVMPDFATLRAMLLYLDEFPHQHHHRKESEILYPKLRARAPLARGLLDYLDFDHARGSHKIRDVEHALLGFEVMGRSHRHIFEQAMQSYVDFYMAHIALEEREIPLLAERVLKDEDWDQLDSAFGENSVQSVLQPTQHEFGALFARIADMAPSLGLGTSNRRSVLPCAS